MSIALASLVEPGAAKRLLLLFGANPADPPPLRRGKRLLQATLVAAGAGAVAGIVAFARGHHVMGTTSEIPWGVLIASYVFFVATSTGLSLVGSLGHVFGVRLFEPLAKKASLLALATLLMGLVCIGTELERPLLLVAMAITSPNPTSPIWWMGALYGIVTVVVALDLYYLLAEDHAKAKAVGVVAVVAEIAANSNLGFVFGSNHARPFWHGPFMPVYFIVTSLVSGAALLLTAICVEDYFAHGRLRGGNAPLARGLARLLASLLAVMAFFTIWRILSGAQGGHRHVSEATLAFVVGPMFTSFWFFEVFLMYLVPFAILRGPMRERPAYLAAAGALPFAAMFVARLDFVYAGQMLSLRPVLGRAGEAIAYSPPFKGSPAGFLAYTPSIVEVLVVFGAMSGALLLYVAGLNVLRLGKEAGRD